MSATIDPKRITSVGEGTVCTSIVVASELRYGALKSASKAVADRVERVLSALLVLPLEAPADRHCGPIRNDLTRRGALIGPNDLLIAAHARALNLTLVTANHGEFTRVQALKVESWLA